MFWIVRARCPFSLGLPTCCCLPVNPYVWQLAKAKTTSDRHDLGMISSMPRPLVRSAYPDGQAFPGEFVDQYHQPKLTTIMRLRLDEVINQTRLRRSGLKRMQELSFSQSQPLGMCF